METLLDALQEGRLFELPENDKTHALQFLAHIIEAFPEIPAGTEIVELVMAREQATNTGIGQGWASPHAGVPFDGDLVCVVGWSPAGIAYGTKDRQPVRLVAMYLVPTNQRSHYLREVSIMAKAVESFPDNGRLESARDLNDVRNYLLDLIAAAKETAVPDTRARMIRLQAKPAVGQPVLKDLSNLVVEPVALVSGAGLRQIALSQNAELTLMLDQADGLIDKLEADGFCQIKDWRVLRRNTAAYEGGRIVYKCLAIRILPEKTQRNRDI
ncbi:MAG: PTS sugar transporter subunit IIA [Desulfobulbus sp.]|jgi:mannitol/fructose-specific phosphotransferase system IIA component (Ntr-type)|uniref:PTS sugar transporter subunit IIA n=1 Tax=Desulfobulbus sp. TaxID=895 RepID=UPI002845707C|nr:PTS sugar transporter subunit IIA [Desulfobulbus sp.]MDR2549570.1 PTS sugar transporter subunit IIA [Desulfobulbus sp.]